ncbi:MAG: DUF4424 family protein [Calditrichaceae bacterium]|nr:DUF4424 family protein [Calditrichaceae bacterium]MBN2708020.1 DUF4424 family protein [Calditrichaceae bacterium]RQV93961.1 MAG: DUF4424 domain-containing protein [Calditrichota bacterium]
MYTLKIRNNFLIKIAFILTIAGLNNFLPAQDMVFFQEEIYIKIENNRCIIDGTYYFKNINSEDIKRVLYYPFPVDNNMTYPDSIFIKDIEKQQRIHFTKYKQGVAIPMIVKAHSISIIRVYYTQKTVVNEAEYILKTTTFWGKPLEKAEFIVELSDNFKLVKLSYDHDSMVKKNGAKFYKITKTNFMPDKNLKITWKE